MPRPVQSNFADALRHVRKSRGLTQEDFDGVSSRVYVSALERGQKQPTITKVDALADVMGVHPLALLALSYCPHLSADEVRRLCDRIVGEVASM